MSFISTNTFIRFNSALKLDATIDPSNSPTGDYDICSNVIYEVYVFNTSGTITFSNPGYIYYALIGGGGGGSGGCTFVEDGAYYSGFGGGGGGGQVLQGTALVGKETVAVHLGQGGVGTVPDTAHFYNANKAGDGESTYISGAFGVISSQGGYGGTSLSGGKSGGGVLGGAAAFDISGGGGGGGGEGGGIGGDGSSDIYTKDGGNGGDGMTLQIGTTLLGPYSGGGGGGGGYFHLTDTYGSSVGGTGGGGSFSAGSASDGAVATGGGAAGGRKSVGTPDGGSGVAVLYWKK
jgi:collagen type III alpha